ncbi:MULTISPECIES: type I restriction enzyme HsdR N-terminal domain-containing protein [unclassified Corallococcus]|uniref:type I restriction enzyme HsdR N-terminal domain-containing protein n=1 Tax=unclassified Corallococcus TaxID=2685029 RepID=UPI001A8F6454|nr:type I restriction enzyme HsdR N-terminal domain-containing protein [Corallococcus sp. NCRR]MBN9686509.1 type I restriction enzyme HsdR N-terminal domain-containing protein [Corallococcus sp. NCSPR001]WAS82064.1 type I restriction enzyme HsdR N-terminal domain-containing protein [Corallococcus sp. NCRR]
MDANQLLELVKRYQDSKSFISNEETAKLALVVPFIRLLGYDPGLPREVRLEYAADFVQGDGKKLPDRMDFAIFDQTGQKPLIVIETKPLGTDLQSRAQQLARYLSQLPELHFGIITDGCHYLFFGDLENPNVMDPEPFFTFSLEDTKSDWAKVAKFLSKFSRESFNATTLITDAENSRYRQGMIDKLSAALKSPGEHEGFLKWLTEDIYKGKRTTAVMERLAEVAKEAIEPTLLRVMGDDFLDKLKERIQRLNEGTEAPAAKDGPNVVKADSAKPFDMEPRAPGDDKTRVAMETTEEELAFFGVVRDICTKNGHAAEDVLYRDTSNYFNVSFKKPTKWFVRFFGNGKRKCIATWVPVEEAKTLASGFEVEASPSAFGISRVYIQTIPEVWALKALVARSLELSLTAKEEAPAEPTLKLAVASP